MTEFISKMMIIFISYAPLILGAFTILFSILGLRESQTVYHSTVLKKRMKQLRIQSFISLILGFILIGLQGEWIDLIS